MRRGYNPRIWGVCGCVTLLGAMHWPSFTFHICVEIALTQRRQHAHICSLLQSWEEIGVNLLKFILGCAFIYVPGYLTKVYTAISMCRGLESLNVLLRDFWNLSHSLPFLSSFNSLSSLSSPSFSSLLSLPSVFSSLHYFLSCSISSCLFCSQ